jgi:hypothetical protein
MDITMLAIDTRPLAHAKMALAMDIIMLAIDTIPLSHDKIPLAMDTTMLAIAITPLSHANSPLAIDTIILRGCKIKYGSVKQTPLRGGWAGIFTLCQKSL